MKFENFVREEVSKAVSEGSTQGRERWWWWTFTM